MAERPEAAPQAQMHSYSVQPVEALSLDDVFIKTVVCFLTLLGGGMLAWATVSLQPGLGYPLMAGGFLVAFILGMINSFKRRPAPLLILSYALVEGLALGAISRIFSFLADGVVTKAILATVVTTFVMLILFKTKVIRNSPTLMRVVLVGMSAIVVFYLASFVMSLFAPQYSPSTVTIAGLPLWLVVSLVAIVLAALSLVTDFDFILNAVENGAPKETAWTAAFGLMVTLVWLYLEFLKIFTYFTQD